MIRSKKILVAFCILLTAVIIDSFLVEPYWLQVSTIDIDAYQLKEPAKFLLLSDLHLHGKTGLREKWILKRISGWNPDAVFVAGDVFDAPAGMAPAIQFLQSLAAQTPVFVVLGNWEHWSRADLVLYRKKLAESQIHLLENSAKTLDLGSSKFSVIGLGDILNRQDELSVAVSQASFPAILLSHEPIIFPKAAGEHVPLVLAGHTHGGQVVLPFWGPLWMPPGCKPYVHGVYSQEGSRMVVTKGVGTSKFPVRFFCRPEVVLLHVS